MGRRKSANTAGHTNEKITEKDGRRNRNDESTTVHEPSELRTHTFCYCCCCKRVTGICKTTSPDVRAGDTAAFREPPVTGK